VGRWLRFGIIGATATAVHIGVAVAAVEGGGVHPQVGNVLGFAVAFVVSYLGQRYFTFGSTQTHQVALLRFAVVAGTGALVNLLVAGVLLKLGLYYVAAIFIGLLTAAVVTYQLNRQWTFTGTRA
jgi:putative flippase GtrA